MPAFRSPHENALAQLAAEVRACALCPNLPLGPSPTFRVAASARLLIIGQAPGTKAHQSGIPWNDPSGERLRSWLACDRHHFYDESVIAIIPAGLCYPGRLANGGDAPPSPLCAATWHARLFALLPEIRLSLLVGGSAQALILGPGPVGERVRHWREFLPRYFPLPHPSWRTTAWERANPWFAAEVLPALRRAVAEAVAGIGAPHPPAFTPSRFPAPRYRRR